MSLIILAETTAKTGELNLVQQLSLGFIALLFITMVPFLFWFIRKTFKIVDKQMQFFQRACEHMEANERHMTSVNQTLVQVVEELKRRPLS